MTWSDPRFAVAQRNEQEPSLWKAAGKRETDTVDNSNSFIKGPNGDVVWDVERMIPAPYRIGQDKTIDDTALSRLTD